MFVLKRKLLSRNFLAQVIPAPGHLSARVVAYRSRSQGQDPDCAATQNDNEAFTQGTRAPVRGLREPMGTGAGSAARAADVTSGERWVYAL